MTGHQSPAVTGGRQTDIPGKYARKVKAIGKTGTLSDGVNRFKRQGQPAASFIKTGHHAKARRSLPHSLPEKPRKMVIRQIARRREY